MPRRRKLLIQKIASLVVSILVLSALLAGVAYYQRGISFEDSNFEAVIRNKLDNPAGPISRSDLLQITHLDASGQNIVSLKGIEKLTRLVYLDLEDNRVADLSPLQNLSRLTELNLRNNKITCLEEINFAAITGLPLRSLSLRHNVVRPEEGGQVRLVDVSLLGELTSLEELDLRDNYITDISPLGNLVSLRILYLRENRIGDISALENLTELTELNLRENEIEDISALSALTNLTYLNLHSNRDIQSVMPLKTLTNLETLILRNVPVGEEIVVMEGMTALKRLNLRNCMIDNTSAMASLMEQGFLQDNLNQGYMAEIDLRENIFPRDSLDPYEPIRDYWANVNYRLPFILPGIDGNKSYIFEKMDGIVDLFLLFQDADLNHLYARNVSSNDRVPVYAQFGKKEIITVPSEIRFRGNSARSLPKKSFDLLFTGAPNPLKESTNLYLNAMYTDPSMMREHLAYNMYHKLDRPAPKTLYANLWINDRYEGLYLIIKQIDSYFLREINLNPNGTLVRDQFRQARDQSDIIDRVSAFGFYLSHIEQSQRNHYLFKSFNCRGNTDWESISELLLWIEKAEPGEDFANAFSDNFNLEIFIDWLALHYLIGDIDSWGDDYFLYIDHEDPEAKWIVIPWDKDLSFGSHTRRGYGGVVNDYFHYQYPIAGGWNNKLIELFLNTDFLRAKLYDRIDELMRIFDLEYFELQIEEAWPLILPGITNLAIEPGAFTMHNKNHHSLQKDYFLHKEALLDFIELRYAYLDRMIHPVDGEAYKARVEIKNNMVGDTIFLTDAEGWAIGKIKLLTVPANYGILSIEVVNNPKIDGIDRSWIIQSNIEEFSAELSLYYRNETETRFSKENWVTSGREPIGEQINLTIAKQKDSTIKQTYQSEVNPYTNKVSAQVIIGSEDVETFVIVAVQP